MRELLKHLTDALARGRDAVVCQVVETRGSTPQKAGALMIVGADGRQLGTLGGGCVEAEVARKALRRVGESGAEILSFILDHDYAWADGLICGGKMVISAEAFRGTAASEYFETLSRLLEAGDGYTEAVVVDPHAVGPGEDIPAGARFLFGPDGRLATGWPLAECSSAVRDRVAPLESRPRPQSRGGVATMPTLPRVRLVIVGAGHVGQAVADLAAQADFDVWVVDDRAECASADRFPRAARLIVGPIEETLSNLDVTPHTYALIVTRGHGHDQEALFHLAPTIAPYVGLIGSRRKIKLIFESLRDAGVAEEALARVAAPVGLEIGSQSVPEIAVSIVAELIARRNLGPSGIPARDDSFLSRGPAVGPSVSV